MRNVLWVFVIASCGGKSPGPTQPVPSNVADPSTMQAPPAQPAGPAGLDKSVCAQRASDFGPVPLTEAQMLLRRGTGAKTFADAPTTKETPIEVCMPAGERGWIASVTCTDGSKPTSSQRAGSMGPGGTCGSIIDLYEVVCPEKTYEVFMDMYMCPAGQ